MQVQPYLFFEGRAEEAIEFYKKTLGAKVEMVQAGGVDTSYNVGSFLGTNEVWYSSDQGVTWNQPTTTRKHTAYYIAFDVVTN